MSGGSLSKGSGILTRAGELEKFRNELKDANDIYNSSKKEFDDFILSLNKQK
jgi:hypothetical protein